jgi:streptomycin 6-kinase
MNGSFIQTLPRDLLVNVRSMCGLSGEEWLGGLPELIKEMERLWEITVGTVYPAAGINYVAPATGRNDEAYVLKIGPPYETTEFASETAFLRSRNGSGCIRLINEEPRYRAILLERAVPGETMDVIYDEREPQCVAPAIEVLRDLVKSVTDPPKEAIDLNTWFENLHRTEGTAFPLEYVARALEIYERLGGSRVTYLHGDFHPRNIVSATRESFLVIDPKGIVGALGYEIAVFLNNFHWWQDERPDIEKRLRVAVRQFADAFDFSELELREWAFAQMVLGAWWTFDEVPEEYDNEVAKADVWGL